MAEPSKFFETKEHDSVVEVILGTADFVSRPIIQLALDDLVEMVQAAKPTGVVVNFQNVNQISSEFITAMIRFRDHVVGNDGKLKFCSLSDQVLTPFKITNLAGTMFDIYEDTNQAIRAF